MIVLIGHPLAAVGAEGRRPAGVAALAAMEASRAGAQAQLVGKVGDDDVGDAVVLALGAAGVGHVAVLRDPSRATPLLVEGVATEDLDTGDDTHVTTIEPAAPEERPTLDAADVELGLRYLTDFRAIVVAEPLDDGVLRVVVDAAGYAGATLVLVGAATPRPGLELPENTLVLAAGGDASAGLASLLARVAVAIDAGQSADEALAAATAGLGATRPA